MAIVNAALWLEEKVVYKVAVCHSVADLVNSGRLLFVDLDLFGWTAVFHEDITAQQERCYDTDEPEDQMKAEDEQIAHEDGLCVALEGFVVDLLVALEADVYDSDGQVDEKANDEYAAGQEDVAVSVRLALSRAHLTLKLVVVRGRVVGWKERLVSPPAPADGQEPDGERNHGYREDDVDYIDQWRGKCVLENIKVDDAAQDAIEEEQSNEIAEEKGQKYVKIRVQI